MKPSIPNWFIIVFTIKGISANSKSHEQQNHIKSKNSPIFQPYQPQQSCDLICPGQPPLALPPNFLQSCQPVNGTTSKPDGNGATISSSTQKVTGSSQNSTTSKPNGPNSTLTTSTESSENGEDGVEGNTENPNSRKADKNKQKKYKNIAKKEVETLDINKRHQKVKSTKENHEDLKKNFQNKNANPRNFKNKNFRSQKVVLKFKDKMKIFKKHSKERYRLDGCYVICPDNQVNVGEVGPNVGPPSNQDSTPSDLDSDNYVEGEDSPLEIIYIPPNVIQQAPPQNFPNNLPQNIPSAEQEIPQIPNNYLQNQPIAPPKIPLQPEGFLPPPFVPQNFLPNFGDPFGQMFNEIPWNFGPLFRGKNENYKHKTKINVMEKKNTKKDFLFDLCRIIIIIHSRQCSGLASHNKNVKPGQERVTKQNQNNN